MNKTPVYLFAALAAAMVPACGGIGAGDTRAGSANQETYADGARRYSARLFG